DAGRPGGVEEVPGAVAEAPDAAVVAEVALAAERDVGGPAHGGQPQADGAHRKPRAPEAACFARMSGGALRGTGRYPGPGRPARAPEHNGTTPARSVPVSAVELCALGAGPGGYRAAIRAAQLGLNVACVEEDRVGGTCLNVGCIPTKAWVQSAHAMKDAHEAFAQLGIRVSGADLDFPQVQENKTSIVDRTVKGVETLLKANGITVVKGRGRFTDANTVEVTGGETVRFRHAVIATGSHSLRPPVAGIDHPRCVDSEGLLEIGEVPERLIVLGGGVIGVEFASIFQHFGTEVTIVEMLDHLIPMEDADAINQLERAFGKRKIEQHLGATATAVEETPDGMLMRSKTRGDESVEVTGDLI